MVEVVTVRNLRLVAPHGTELVSGPFALADRPSCLVGKTLGLMENGKANSDKVLGELGSLLTEKYRLKAVVYFSKHNASLPARQEVIQQVLDQVDVLITGVGD